MSVSKQPTSPMYPFSYLTLIEMTVLSNIPLIAYTTGAAVAAMIARSNDPDPALTKLLLLLLLLLSLSLLL